jgi:hypothetical protein
MFLQNSLAKVFSSHLKITVVAKSYGRIIEDIRKEEYPWSN